LDFSVDEDTFYAASGFYDVNDVVEPGEVYMWISLYDLTESRYNFFHSQASDNTQDESFYVGGLGGDPENYLSGPLAGELISGHSYRFFWDAYIYASPDGDSGATAVGNFTLTIGDPVTTVPLPAALPLFLSGLVGLGVVGWRKRKTA
jgi:PEP-CTERM motif